MKPTQAGNENCHLCIDILLVYVKRSQQQQHYQFIYPFYDYLNLT